ncbi:MAG: hypothetical protein VW079_01665 [Candidatus Woesearchaeota archaeon]
MDSYNYEDLYELLRNEKFSTDLQDMSLENLKKIRSYFNERNNKLNESESSNMFSSHNKLKIQGEIDNATRIVNDLINIRERKIINRAIFTSRSNENIEDTSNMIEIEKKLYDFLNVELKKFRKSYLYEIENRKVNDKKHKKYVVLEDIPLLSDGINEYGPYEKNDFIELPNNIANILINESKIKEESEEFKNKVITEDIEENEISKTSKNVLSSEGL